MEDIIDDIGEIIDLSSDTGEAKMSRNIRKVRSTKGRIEKIKKGSSGTKKNKTVVARRRANKRVTRRKKEAVINSNIN